MKLDEPILLKTIKQRELGFIGQFIRSSVGEKLMEILKTTATVGGKGKGGKWMTWLADT